MISAILLGIVIFSALIVAIVYFFVLQPMRIIEQWAAGLSNGGHFPKKPDVKGLYWLLPIHRELQAVCDKIDNLKERVSEANIARSQDEFLYHCILASLIEGILVVDAHGVITLVNAEFINIFQLTQSPLQRPVADVIWDKKLQTLITDALTSGHVHSARIARPQATTEVGRPPTMEVSAVPIRTQKERTNGVIVLFLPPPDRTRILQSMKRHSQRLDNLVNELMLASATHGESLQLKKEPVDLRELLETAVSIFRSKSESSGIKAGWHLPGDIPPFFADPSCLQVALVHLLVNLAFDYNGVTEVNITAGFNAEWVIIRVLFAGCAMQEAELQRAFESPFDLPPQRQQIVGSASGLSLVREIVNLHGGRLSFQVSQENQTIISIELPREAPDLEPGNAPSLQGILPQKNMP